MRLVWGGVTAVVEAREGVQRLHVVHDTGDERQALCYPALTGVCSAGDRVLVNATAVDLSLGTGGVDIVVARVRRGSSAEGVAHDDTSGGHIMKLRYTPLQRDVLAVEEQGSPHHPVMVRAEDAGGMPVVCCGLHSQVPLVAAAVREARPDVRIAYVMTDQGTLALPMSDVVAASRSAGLVDTTVTCGQAFGGDLEAVNLYSGLLAARHAALADVAVVAIGPGVTGTGTPFGHGGVAQGEAVNAASSVGARAIACLRISFADERERHRGVSHHTLIALTRVALVSAVVPLPFLWTDQMERVERDLADGGVWDRHERWDSEREPGVIPDLRGTSVESMGRTPDDDPAFFAAAAAAGDAAVGIL